MLSTLEPTKTFEHVVQALLDGFDIAYPIHCLTLAVAHILDPANLHLLLQVHDLNNTERPVILLDDCDVQLRREINLLGEAVGSRKVVDLFSDESLLDFSRGKVRDVRDDVDEALQESSCWRIHKGEIKWFQRPSGLKEVVRVEREDV